jgi:group I intron endonuclease
MAAGIIYLATNRVNGKAYVGRTMKGLAGRFTVHIQKARLGYSSHFYRAIRKYGIESFDVAVVETCASEVELKSAEERWIAAMGSKAPVGYNLTDGGEGIVGFALPKSDRWRQSVTSESYRAKHSRRAKLWRAAMTPEERAAHTEKIANKLTGTSNVKLRGDANPAKRAEVRDKIRMSKLGKRRPDMLGNKWAQGKS